MLPQSGSYGYGYVSCCHRLLSFEFDCNALGLLSLTNVFCRKRRQQSSESVIYIVLVALVVAVLGLGWGYSSQRSHGYELRNQVDKLQNDIRAKSNEVGILRVSDELRLRHPLPRIWILC
jgi:hypothetical protein